MFIFNATSTPMFLHCSFWVLSPAVFMFTSFLETSVGTHGDAQKEGRATTFNDWNDTDLLSAPRILHRPSYTWSNCLLGRVAAQQKDTSGIQSWNWLWLPRGTLTFVYIRSKTKWRKYQYTLTISASTMWIPPLQAQHGVKTTMVWSE